MYLYIHVCMYVQVTSVFKEYWRRPLADYIVTIAQLHRFCTDLRYEPGVPVMSPSYGSTSNN